MIGDMKRSTGSRDAASGGRRRSPLRDDGAVSTKDEDSGLPPGLYATTELSFSVIPIRTSSSWFGYRRIVEFALSELSASYLNKPSDLTFKETSFSRGRIRFPHSVTWPARTVQSFVDFLDRSISVHIALDHMVVQHDHIVVQHPPWLEPNLEISVDWDEFLAMGLQNHAGYAHSSSATMEKDLPLSSRVGPIWARLADLAEAGEPERPTHGHTEDDVLGAISVTASKIRELEGQLDSQVKVAREMSVSWRAIGKAAMMNATVAWRRWDEEARRKQAEYQRSRVRRSGRPDAAGEDLE
jgi:hypothetical protein